MVYNIARILVLDLEIAKHHRTAVITILKLILPQYFI